MCRSVSFKLIIVMNDWVRLWMFESNCVKNLSILKFLLRSLNFKSLFTREMIRKWFLNSLKYNILDMRICNGNRDPFVISEPSLHDWLTNKNKSYRDSIRDNYDDNYVNWSLRNLLLVILSIYIDLSRFICNRSTGRLLFEIDNCWPDRFMSIVNFRSTLCNQIDFSWQSI